MMSTHTISGKIGKQCLVDLSPDAYRRASGDTLAIYCGLLLGRLCLIICFCELATGLLAQSPKLEPLEPITSSTHFGFVLGGPALPSGAELDRRDGFRLYRQGFESQSLQLLDSLHTALAGRADVDDIALAYLKLPLARLLERHDELARAILLTQQLLQTPNIHQHQRLLAETYILNELIHEKLEQIPEALKALAQARDLIHRAGLDSVAPVYYVRVASFDRIFGNKGVAKHYVDSALATAAAVASYDALADAKFLHSRLHWNEPGYDPIASLRESASINYRIGNYSGYAYLYGNIASAYHKLDEDQAALRTLDTTLALFYNAQKRGYFVEPLRFGMYALKADILRQQGQLDSAYHYLTLSKSLELKYAYDLQGQEVLRLQQAAAQAQAQLEIESRNVIISSERTQRRLLVIASVTLAMLGLGLAVLSIRLSRAKQRIARQVERQAVLRDELQHRVKNNFQILISFLELQSEQASSEEVIGAFTAMAARVHNLAAIHALLYDKSDVEPPNLQHYVSHLVTHFQELSTEASGLSINIEIENLPLAANQSMALGIIINELLTNSAKHAKALIPTDKVSVTLHIFRSKDNVILEYKDNGYNVDLLQRNDTQTNPGKLGLYLIDAMVRQMNGKRALHHPSDKRYETTITIPTISVN